MTRDECTLTKAALVNVLKETEDAEITTMYERGEIRVLSSGMSLTPVLLTRLAKVIENRKVWCKRSGTKFGFYIS